eukprot:GILI01003442.1.p1 GENE.GILI01003442.1~~GILI01003442.1.p1  ORF type:complete len:1135 (+),score=293.79 GILI01003442.1:191-3595(+)
MGNGASSADVELHLRKWESAVSDINTLCQAHKRQLGTADHAQGAGGDGHGRHTLAAEDAEGDVDRSLRGRRASSISFNNRPKVEGDKDNVVLLGSGDTADRGGEARTPGKPIEFLATTNEGTPKDKQGAAKHNRQQLIDARKARTALFKTYVDVPIASVVNKLACDHFATVAIALSTALGGSATSTDRKLRVTVEDIFFAAHVPLHLVHKEGLCLTELYDIVREFVDVDNRFKRYQVEVLYLDIAPVTGQVEIGSNEVGDRQSKLQLPQFIKTVQHELDEATNSVMVFNYDPYVLEQETTMDVEDDEEEEVESASQSGAPISARGVAGLLSATNNDPLMTSVMFAGAKGKKPRYAPNNKGAYAAAVEYRQAVSTMITLCRGVTDEKLHGELEEVPINSVYKAMTSHAAGERARGYIRISKIQGGDEAAQQETPNEDMELFFTPELASGRVIGSLAFGIQALAISTSFSPHIVAVAWSLHLIHGAVNEYGRGLPVADIIRVMNLPSDMYINCDLSLDQVYLYAEAYLSKKKYDKQFTLSYHPVLTPIAREGAAPTISVFDLESILIEVRGLNDNKELPSAIMIIQYNPEVAHNVLGISSTSQWCILAGYDSATQMATMIDANMVTFSGKWSVPLDRLHKAVTTYGYLLLTRAGESGKLGKSLDSSRSSTPSNARGDRPQHSAVQNRVEMVKSAVLLDFKETIHTFSYPPKPFALTTLALSLSQLGINDATFDSIIAKLPFHPSTVLDGHFGLSALLICYRKYLTVLDKLNWFDFKATYFDPERRPTEKDFIDLMKKALAVNGSGSEGKSLLILHYDHKAIKILGSREPFGDYGILTDLVGDSVTVTDVNPNRFYRTWQVPISMLYSAICHRSHVSRRSRGVISITHLNKEAVPVKPTFTRHLTLTTAPIQNLFLVSPSPQIQALSIAFSQLGHFHSPEEIFYEAYLKTMEDQRRRGSQAFAWRDVDVSLAILNRKIDMKVMAQVARKFIESRKVQNLTANHMSDVEVEALPEMLAEACSDSADHVLLLNYDAASVHGLKNMGSSVAIVKSFDAETTEVTMFDCEYCLFGLEWKCSLDRLAAAADLDNAGASKYGFVVIKAQNQEKRSAGIGLAGVSKPAEGGATHHREKVAKFVT